MCKQAKTQAANLYLLQAIAQKQAKEAGERCICFSQQNKDPLSAAVPQQPLTIIIYILVEPVYRKTTTESHSISDHTHCSNESKKFRIPLFKSCTMW